MALKIIGWRKMPLTETNCLDVNGGQQGVPPNPQKGFNTFPY